MRNTDVPYLHAFKDGLNNQLKLEDLLLRHRGVVRAFYDNVWTCDCESSHPTFCNEVLPYIWEANLLPPPIGYTREAVTDAFLRRDTNAAEDARSGAAWRPTWTTRSSRRSGTAR